MTNEFENWPSRFQKPGEEEEEHVIQLNPWVLVRIRKKLDTEEPKPKRGESSGDRQDERK